MPHSSFRSCQDVERESLEILRPFITQHCINGQYVLIEKGRLSKELQQTYGDVFINRFDGRLCAIEMKAEAENKHGNLFIETWSNRERWNVGWLYKLKTDVLMYHFLADDQLFVMSFEELKRWLFMHENGKRPRIAGYVQRVQSKHSQLNDTWGVTVPIAHLRIGLKSFREFVASTGARRDLEKDLFGGHAA